MATKKRTPAELWKAIEDSAADDEAERILALSDAELDAELAAEGADPAKIRAEGVAFVEKLMAARDERAWEADAAKKLAAVRERFEARAGGRAAGREKLSRAELLARIAEARANPRFAQPVSVMFRNRKTEEASDEELEALLAEIEALAEHEE